MNDVKKRFEQQTRWQKSLRDLPWHEKVQMAEKIKEGVKQLRNVPGRKKKSNLVDSE